MAKSLSQDANEIEFKLEPHHLSSLFAALKMPSLNILAKAITNIPALKEEIVNLLSSEISSVSKSLGARKHNRSVLMVKDFESLKKSNIEDMIAEFKANFPSLFNQILALMIPDEKKKSPVHYDYDTFEKFPNMSMSPKHSIDSFKLNTWFREHKKDQINPLNITSVSCPGLLWFTR